MLAAGYATRLSPLTDLVPKPLLSVGGMSIVDRTLDALLGVDLADVTLVTNDRFASTFTAWAAGRRARTGQRTLVINDGTRSDADRRGAIGDIELALSSIGSDQPLLIVAGDNIFTHAQPQLMRELAAGHDAVGTYDVGSVDAARGYGIVSVDDNGAIASFYEKPTAPASTLAAVALYAYSPPALRMVGQYLAEGNNPDQPGRLVQWLYQRQRIVAVPIEGAWFDVGTHASYAAASAALQPSCAT